MDENTALRKKHHATRQSLFSSRLIKKNCGKNTVVANIDKIFGEIFGVRVKTR